MVEGELPLEVQVARNETDPSVVVELSIPLDHFEVDWNVFRDQLKQS
jgi:hypothetical protein